MCFPASALRTACLFCAAFSRRNERKHGDVGQQLQSKCRLFFSLSPYVLLPHSTLPQTDGVDGAGGGWREWGNIHRKGEGRHRSTLAHH